MSRFTGPDTPYWVTNTVGAHLLGWAVRMGAESADILAHAGLDAELFRPPQRRIATGDMQALWKAVADELGDPACALRSGACAAVSIASVTGPLASVAASLRKALEHLATHSTAFSNAIEVTVADLPDGGGLAATWCFLDPETTGTWFVPESISAHWVTFPERLGNHPYAPLEIAFPFARPPHHATIAEFFGCPVKYDAQHLRLVWPEACADDPFVTHDARVEADLLRTAARLAPPSAPSFSDQVREALLSVDRPAAYDLRTVARMLGVSSRTLQRRLAEDDTTFRHLQELVLVRRARELLEADSIGVGEITDRLGYQSRSSFHRAFVGWTGTTPVAWRADRQSGASSDDSGAN